MHACLGRGKGLLLICCSGQDRSQEPTYVAALLPGEALLLCQLVSCRAQVLPERKGCQGFRCPTPTIPAEHLGRRLQHSMALLPP